MEKLDINMPDDCTKWISDFLSTFFSKTPIFPIQ